MDSLKSLMEKVGSNFFVAAMIPSLTFVTLVLVTFKTYLPFPLDVPIFERGFKINNPGLLLILSTLIIGFTLSSLNTFVIKLFEGYIFLERFPNLRKGELERARNERTKIQELEKRISLLLELLDYFGKDDKKLNKLLDDAIRRKDFLETKYFQSFPFSEDLILPTQFGNSFRSFESYSRDRYEIDAVPMWPRLFYTIPDKYINMLDAKNNEISFLLNCSVLSILFSVLAGISLAHQWLSLGIDYFWPNLLGKNALPVFSYQSGIIYTFVLLVAIIAVRVFYKGCLLIVGQYGELVCGAYDLFRSDLLLQLNFKRPANDIEERSLWTQISGFINLGPNPFYKSGREKPVFDYSYDQKERIAAGLSQDDKR